MATKQFQNAKLKVDHLDLSSDTARSALQSGENISHSLGKIARWYKDIVWSDTKATIDAYGIIKLSDDYKSTSTDTVPTSKTLNDVVQLMKQTGGWNTKYDFNSNIDGDENLQNGQFKVTEHDIEGDINHYVTIKGLGSAAFTDSDEYATAGHTHLYAGSSTVGGVANSAAKLSDIPAGGIGSETNPVYFSGTTGRPVACTYSLNASVPSGAIFTDEKVKQSPVTTDGSFEVLFAGSAGNTEKTEGVGKTTTLVFNPSKGALTATSFSGSGASLTSLNASKISSGTLAVARLADSGVVAGTYGPAANASLAHAGTFDVPDFTVDAKGRVTGAHTRTFTLPAQYVHPTHTSYDKGLYKISVDALGHITSATAVVKSDITGLGIPAQDTVYTHPTYTSKTSGLYKITVDSLGHVSATASVTKTDIPALDYISSTTTRNPNVVLAGPASGTTAAAPTFRALVAADLPASGATAGSYGPSANATPGYGATFNVPYITVDAKGRVTSISNKTVKIPASDNTNTTYTLSGAYGSGSNTWVTTLTPSSGSATTSTVPVGTTSAYGLMKLYNGVDSTSTALAATANAVKTAYDKANHSHPYVPKTTYEYNYEIKSPSGHVCIGKFPCYDTNITCDISITAANTINGTLVIATQNINTSGGGSYEAVVYGDPTNELVDLIYIDHPSGSNIFGVYLKKVSWGDILIHVQVVSNASAAPTDIKTIVSDIPTTATIRPSNVFEEIPTGGANLLQLFVGSGSNTSVTNNVLTIGTVDKDTYFYLKAARPIKSGIRYVLSCDYESESALGLLRKWVFGFGGQTNANVQLFKNVYNNRAWCSFISTTNIDANATITVDDKSRDVTNPITLSNFKLELGMTPSDYCLIDTSRVKTASTVTNSGWTTGIVDNNLVPSMSFIAYWNGAYSSNNVSNLRYCNQGAFGTIVTKGSEDYVPRYTISTATDINTVTATGFHHIKTQSCTNVPTTNHALLIVDSTVGTKFQIFIPDNADTTWYKRHYDSTNSKWGSWATLKLTDTVYTHPTTSGNKHIPSGGSSGQFLKWSSDGTAVWSALPTASTSAAGIVQLNNTVSSTSTTQAATANAVKTTYDTLMNERNFIERHLSFTANAVGWYRVLTLNTTANNEVMGALDTSCGLIFKRWYNNTNNEHHEIKFVNIYQNAIFVNEISRSNDKIITQIRYVYTSSAAYIDMYYNSTATNTVYVTVKDNFNKALWTPLATISTVAASTSGETVKASYSFSNNIHHGLNDTSNYTNILLGNQSSSAVPVTTLSAGYLKTFYNVNSGLSGNMPATNNANFIIQFNKHSGNYDSQLGFSNNGKIYYRSCNAAVLSSSIVWEQLLFKSHIATGTSNGTISIDGTNVAVKGLGSNAYTSTSYLPLGGGAMTGTISSSVTTVSHLAGNKGTVIINSTALAGYNMLARMKSTNGVFTFGAYNTAFNLYYTADTIISAGTNNTTKRVTLLDESGNAEFPGLISATGIRYVGTKSTNTMIQFIDNTNDGYGNGISIGGGGLVVVGGGESASALVTDASLGASSEALYLTSDSGIHFYTNCNTIANRKGVSLDNSLNFYPRITGTGSVGHASYKWNTMYANTFYGAFSGSGASLTSLNANNISSGTLSADRLAASGATAGSYGPSANASPAHSGTFSVPYITVDAKGRVTAISTKTITLPASGNTDTKNTAGSTNTSSKIFLIGATSQAANPQTYSHDTAYVGTDGCLYSNSAKVSVEGHTHSKIVTEGDNRSVATTPNDYSAEIRFRGLKEKATINDSTDTPISSSYAYLIGLRGWNDSSGGNAHELAFSNDSILHRNGATTSWGAWRPIAEYVLANGYWGLVVNGSTSAWVRTTTNGIIPVQSGASGSGHSSLGTASWYFSTSYVDTMWGSAVCANRFVSRDGSMDIQPGHSNEINFGGSSTSGNIYFGYRSVGSRPIPVTYTFGSSTGTASIVCDHIKIGGTSTYCIFKYNDTDECVDFVFG